MTHLKTRAEKLAFAQERIEQYRVNNSFIHPSVTIPDHVILGKNVIIHEHCTLGTEGLFCVVDNDGNLLTVPHIGKLIIEDNVEIQAGTNISRGVTGDTVIGAYTKIAAHCHIAHEVRIGKNTIICAQANIAGFVTIGDRVWIGPGCSLKEKLKIADEAFIGIGSTIIRDIDKGHSVVGNPGRVIKTNYPIHITHFWEELR